MKFCIWHIWNKISKVEKDMRRLGLSITLARQCAKCGKVEVTDKLLITEERLIIEQ